MRLFPIIGTILVCGAAAAEPCPSRPSWPTAGWPVQLVDPIAKAAEIAELETFAFTLTGKDSERQGVRTDSLLIFKRGTLVYEKYARGFDVDKPHLSWSIAKSFTSALIGVAVKEGVVSLSDSICRQLPEAEATGHCDVTVEQLLSFSSGILWQEEYENGVYQHSSIISMLYGSGHRDQLAHILSHPLRDPPGARWSYSTADAQLAALIAKRALEAKHGKDAFWVLLFDRIGLGELVVEEDLKGMPQGGSAMYATPRDFAKFGFLFLNDGCWNGERLLPEGWVKKSVTPSAAYVATLPAEPRPNGLSWWLNRALPEVGRPKPWPDAPEDAYAASGYWGQRIIVIPSEDLLIVRFGDDRKQVIDANGLITRAMAVAR